jgi:drug/metabolite transporter (DMT)-like permease
MGDVLLFLTSVAYALFTVLTKKTGVSSMGASFALIIVVTLVSFPVALVLGNLNPARLSMGIVGWGAVFYLSTACTIVAVTLYLKGLSSIKASEAGVLFLVQVLEGLVLSAALLGEFLSVVQIIGAAAILLALAFGVLHR